MESAEENVDMLSRAILSEAQAETEQLRKDAQSKADAVLARAQEQVAAERTAILEQASQEAERIRSQIVATAQLKARALDLERREKMLDRVFDAARQQLPRIQHRDDYGQLVVRLVREAVTQLGAAKAEIRADRTTEKFLTAQVLDKLCRETQAELSVGKTLEQGIGVIVEASDGHLHFDNTLETRLIRLQGGLRSSVFHTLMGESHE